MIIADRGDAISGSPASGWASNDNDSDMRDHDNEPEMRNEWWGGYDRGGGGE